MISFQACFEQFKRVLDRSPFTGSQFSNLRKVEGNPMAKRILVVDDKKEIRTLLKDYMTQEGYDIVEASDGKEALTIARHEKPDLIILDIMMPEMSGYEFMRLYSRESATPVIILTARLDENDKVLGLELGADDYVTKPFSIRELTARVHAVLRRIEKQEIEKDIVRAADITLDRSTRQVMVADREVMLTPSEFDLLAAIMSVPGKAFNRMELLDRLQGGAYEGYERTIDVHVRNLRAKIEEDDTNPQYIETVYGVGYRFTRGKKASGR